MSVFDDAADAGAIALAALDFLDVPTATHEDVAEVVVRAALPVIAQALEDEARRSDSALIRVTDRPCSWRDSANFVRGLCND